MLGSETREGRRPLPRVSSGPPSFLECGRRPGDTYQIGLAWWVWLATQGKATQEKVPEDRSLDPLSSLAIWCTQNWP